MHVDTVVVGAGMAGLSAALMLTKAGQNCVVLEARDRVGGRAWSETRPDGTVVDHGGQWVGVTQTRMLELIEELGVDLFPSYDEGIGNRSLGGKEQEFVRLADMFTDLEAMAHELPQDAPWTHPRAAEWDSQSFYTWLDKRFGDTNARKLASLVVSALFTAEPQEISLLHWLIYIRSAGSIAQLTEVPGGAQEFRFVKGSQELAKRMAEEIGQQKILLASPVRFIRQSDSGVEVVTDNRTIAADRVIVAAPIAVVERIGFTPPLPANRVQLHHRAIPGTVIKIHCVYDQPFWRERGSNGRNLSDSGPVTVTFDNSPSDERSGVIVGFVEGDPARDFRQLSADERRKVAMKCFVDFFGPEAANPKDYVETDWSNEEWTRGCFGSNFPTGAWTRYGDLLTKPVGRIHWAGAETSLVWMNYFEGAVRSGERAAQEILAL